MIAYLDLPAGLSGDMLLGCLVDAGWPLDRLRACLAALRLPTDAYAVAAEPVQRSGLRALQVVVQTEEGPTHRHLTDVLGIIEAASLSDRAAALASDVFRHLAEAEAEVHGTTPAQVHFHEVGAVDAIIDIVGVACGLVELQIDTLYASAVPTGHGWVQCAHGRMPVPAPATLALLRAAGAPLHAGPGPGELVTPTAAAILRTLARFEQPPMRLEAVGIGAGTRDPEWPNLARLWLGTEGAAGSMVEVETNIDDMNPQLYAAVSASLFAAGAVDVWMTPVQMKKSRPGVVLSALAPAAQESALAKVLFEETTTAGVRVRPVRRHEAKRAHRQVSTSFGDVSVKVRWFEDRAIGASPEFDDCASAAARASVPVRVVYEEAVAAARTLLDGMAPPPDDSETEAPA